MTGGSVNVTGPSATSRRYSAVAGPSRVTPVAAAFSVALIAQRLAGSPVFGATTLRLFTVPGSVAPSGPGPAPPATTPATSSASARITTDNSPGTAGCSPAG